VDASVALVRKGEQVRRSVRVVPAAPCDVVVDLGAPAAPRLVDAVALAAAT